MEEYSQLRKIVSILMIFILLIYLSGCYSTRIISSSDLPFPGSSKHDYIIHGQYSKCVLDNAVISNGILSGRIEGEDSTHTGYKIHVFLSSDSVMKINTEKIFSVPLDRIAKIEIRKVAAGKTILLVVGLPILVLGIIFIHDWYGFPI
jgi:hypothetical protein